MKPTVVCCRQWCNPDLMGLQWCNQWWLPWSNDLIVSMVDLMGLQWCKWIIKPWSKTHHETNHGLMANGHQPFNWWSLDVWRVSLVPTFTVLKSYLQIYLSQHDIKTFTWGFIVFHSNIYGYTCAYSVSKTWVDMPTKTPDLSLFWMFTGRVRFSTR